MNRNIAPIALASMVMIIVTCIMSMLVSQFSEVLFIVDLVCESLTEPSRDSCILPFTKLPTKSKANAITTTNTKGTRLANAFLFLLRRKLSPKPSE